MTNRAAPHRGLAGVRVVDFGQYLAGPLAAMMLGDFGADVIRVDPLGGPRWDHPANAVLQRNKRSVLLDLKDADDVEFARDLISTADVVIEGFRPGVMARLGLDPKEICALHSDLIWCSIPGFGHDDPRADMAAFEGMICSAASLYPPFMFAQAGGPRFSAIPYASNFGGFIAAHSIVAALIARERYGHGDQIEVPLFDAAMEAVAITLEDPPSDPFERIAKMLGNAGIKNPADLRLYKGRDGHFIRRDIPNRGKHNFWDRFMPDGLKDDTSPAGTRRAAEILEKLLGTKDAREWEDLAQRELRAAFATHQTTVEWLHDDHALDSQSVIVVDDPLLGRTHQAGFGTRVSTCPPAVRFGRRLPGADDAEIRSGVASLLGARKAARRVEGKKGSAKPLEGIRVLDFTSLVAGPGTSRILVEYGAECIKIAKTGVAYGKINFFSEEVGMLMGHRTTAAGKKTMFIDLRVEQGREIAQALAATADVICHNFAMGVPEEMGIAEDQLRELRPDLIYSTVNVHGRGGSRESYRGIEHLGQTVTGAMLRFGGRDAPEALPILMNDYGTPHLSAMGILIALFQKFRYGGGSRVEAALSRTATLSQIPFMIAYQGRSLDEPEGPDVKGWGICDRLYECADGWLYLAAVGEENIARLHDVDGLNEAMDATGGAKEAALEAALKSDCREEWLGRLAEAGVPAHAYFDLQTLLRQPILFERGMAVLKDHPGMAPGRVIGIPARFASMPNRSVPAAARPGWDTVEILQELGFGSERIADLIAAEVVAGPMPPGSPIDPPSSAAA